jgi:hypothetical protein
MISCVWLRDLARLGRVGPVPAGAAGLHRAGASRRRPVTDAASIADRPSARPRRTGSCPRVDDLVELLI